MTNNKNQINNKSKITKKNKQYDLEERTLKFSKNVVEFSKKAPRSTVTVPLIDQLVRSATSIGANYIEANEALSKKDFINRIRICRKEAKETRYWLFLIIEAWPEGKAQTQSFLQEAKEFVLMFPQMLKNTTGRTRFV